MMPGSLLAAISTTVVRYDLALAPDVPSEQVLAEALNAAATAATGEAREKMGKAAEGKEIELRTCTLTSIVNPGSIVMTCVLLFEVFPFILDAPSGEAITPMPGRPFRG